MSEVPDDDVAGVADDPDPEPERAFDGAAGWSPGGSWAEAGSEGTPAWPEPAGAAVRPAEGFAAGGRVGRRARRAGEEPEAGLGGEASGPGAPEVAGGGAAAGPGSAGLARFGSAAPGSAAGPGRSEPAASDSPEGPGSWEGGCAGWRSADLRGRAPQRRLSDCDLASWWPGAAGTGASAAGPEAPADEPDRAPPVPDSLPLGSPGSGGIAVAGP